MIGLQQRVPRELVGRTMAVIRSAQYIGMLLGAIAAVSLVGPLGWEATVLIVCAVGSDPALRHRGQRGTVPPG